MKEEAFCYRTDSPEATVELGRKVGEHLNSGDVVVLSGELGCGKTWFAKGIALGLGITEVVTSPSFALMNAYEGSKTLFHMDVYRLESQDDFLDTGLDECFEGDGVVLMEWGDWWPEILPPRRLMVNFRILGEQRRELIVKGAHSRMRQVLEALKKSMTG